ncbi:MAG: hypothetical protein H6814_05545 [Phycisphaeraceae bacterium]|nr:hypothetical protein [Phycisphaeraceae bacterium]
MRISPAHARILESRLSRRLEQLGAERIALLGAGRFTRALLETTQSSDGFAGAPIDAIIDESGSAIGHAIHGVPVVGSAEETVCDAIVIATPMHERAVLDRAALGVYGDIPVIGLHTIEDERELEVDALLLAETAWFGLDLPGLIVRSGRSCTIAAATGLPGAGAIDTVAFWEDQRDTHADEVRWEGLELYEFVKGSAACLLGTANIDRSAHRETLTALMDETIRIHESAMRIFAKPHSPRIVVVANGLLHHQRAVAEAALRSGRRAIAIEASCFPGLCHLELGSAQTGARCALGRSIRDRLEGAALTDLQRQRTTAYLRSRAPHKEQRTDSASQPPPVSPRAIRRELGIPEGGRVLLLLGQVCTDTTLIYDAPVTNDVVELSRLASDVVADMPGWTLVIKPHPKESTGADPIAGRPYTRGAYDRLRDEPMARAPHVRLVGPAQYNVYTLMELADAGLAINSQSALEMIAMFARPVCLVGRAAFSGAGFTVDVAHRAALAPTLRAMLDNPELTRRQHDMALRYVDAAVFENLIPSDVRTPDAAMARDNEAIRALLGDAVGPGSIVEHKHNRRSVTA